MNEDKIVIEEPPANRNRGRQPLLDWNVFIEELKKHPGKFARLNIPEEFHSPTRYSQWAHGIKNNKIKAFRDSGHKWDASSSKDGLWVKMVS